MVRGVKEAGELAEDLVEEVASEWSVSDDDAW